ncbi:TRAP transporter small permease subunit [Vreelandella nigrificans]|uniref:TRAP transporter small permease protein n=1 Tax=Vreelandella nigrificans TaxID=2042704 RepID=A0A2A4HMQ4_9GAMM|nr:TRAP transporter small permease subunit [Halomonas nigrificans]PCF96056.1 ABC transporter substrate-binding protein [Halomonas nigrificans]
MHYVKSLCGYITAMNLMVGRVVGYSIYLIFILLIAEVIMRYFFRQPTTWTGELSQLVFGAYVMLSGAYLLANKGHVNVDIFYQNLGPRTQSFINLLTSFLFFAFILVLITEGWELASDSISRIERSGSAWNPQIWPVKLAVPVGACLLLLQGIANFVEDFLILIEKNIEI